MRQRHLKAVPPPVDSEFVWHKLLNKLYIDGENELFLWGQVVRAAVEEAERQGS